MNKCLHRFNVLAPKTAGEPRYFLIRTVALPPMGRAIRKSKGPAEPQGGPSPSPVKPKPWPMPKEMRRVPSNPSSPEASPSKPRQPRRSSRARAKKQLVENPASVAEALASLPAADARLATDAPVPLTRGGARGSAATAAGRARVERPGEASPATESGTSDGDVPKDVRFETVGGRARSADGAWLAWTLTRPVVRGKPDTKRFSKKLPVTVLVNGLSNDGFQWFGLNDALVAPDRALVAWDFRGHGASGDPRDLKTVTVAGVADDLEQVLCDISARGLADTEKVTLVAYSMGCQVALEWCRAHAQYVRGVALVLGTARRSMDSACRFPIIADALARLMRAFPETFACLWGVLFTLAHYFPRIAHACARIAGIMRVTYAQFAPFYEHARRVSGAAQNAMLVSGQAHAAADVLALLDRREVPTLVVSGGKDVAVNRAAARATQQAAPRARYVHIPNACHAGMVGERDAVAAALAEFFRLERETNEFNRRRLMEATGMRSSPGSPAKVR